jgi:hypothetical protein
MSPSGGRAGLMGLMLFDVMDIFLDQGQMSDLRFPRVPTFNNIFPSEFFMPIFVSDERYLPSKLHVKT